MVDRLAPILADARRRADALAPDISRVAEGLEPGPSLADALRGPGLAVIAEVKRRSPSRGDLAPTLDPVTQANRYGAGGAAAISVLTEPHHFSGSEADLRAVRASLPAMPVLRKDFTVDERQVWEARGMGASAVLLIVAALDQAELTVLHAAAIDAGLDALVEVHDAGEAARALDAGATLVGVNNRDLVSFEVDLAVAERIADRLDGAAVTVAESGIWTGADAGRMADAGYDAVLVGEALVRADDPAALLGELRGG